MTCPNCNADAVKDADGFTLYRCLTRSNDTRRSQTPECLRAENNALRLERDAMLKRIAELKLEPMFLPE